MKFFYENTFRFKYATQSSGGIIERCFVDLKPNLALLYNKGWLVIGSKELDNS